MEAAKTTTDNSKQIPAAMQAVPSVKNSGLLESPPPALFIQKKLVIGSPDDEYEKEADHMADKVMQTEIPASINFSEGKNSVQRKCEHCEEEEKLQRKPFASFIHRKENNTANVAEPGIVSRIESANGGGDVMNGTTKNFMENRFGADFSSVRIHTNNDAVQMSNELNAQAFTVGSDIYFNAGKYSPGSTEGKHLLAHELTHTVQQGSPDAKSKGNQISPRIQRRLVTLGTLPDVNAFLGLLGPPAGLTLALNVNANQAQITAVSPVAPRSPTLRARLTAIINHPTQHAEMVIARGQPQVFVGAFPTPSDLTVMKTQQVDIDDLLAIEAGAPGDGAVLAIHEIEENFRAHGLAPVAGTDRFAATHQQAINVAENPVAAELIGPGRRVAQVQVPGSILAGFNVFGVHIPGSINAVANTTAIFFDYENYYLGMTSRFVAATQDAQIANAQRFPKTTISTRTIDNFASGTNVLPAAGAAIIAAAAADVAANPTATVEIQGFSDSVGNAATNVTVSQNRANAAAAALRVAGVGGLRMHAEGHGATNFVAPNAAEADRARNRRVTITVTTPRL